MKAVVIHQFGNVDQLRIEDVREPELSGNDVLVKVHSASINPSDVKNVRGKMHGTQLPRIPGRDFAGVVVKGTPEMIGKKVWGTGGDLGKTRDGSHAEFVVVPTTGAAILPNGLSLEAAGVAGLSYITAWEAMVTTAKVVPGETVLVIGATGGTGSAAVQIAKVHGARVIAVVRSNEDVTIVRAYGADETINAKTTNLVDAVKSLTANLGAEIVFDGSGMMFAEAVECAAMDARMPIIAAPADGMATFNLRNLYRKTLAVCGIDTLRLSSSECGKLLTQMNEHFETGNFSVKAPKMMPLSKAAEAYALAGKGGTRIALQP